MRFIHRDKSNARTQTYWIRNFAPWGVSGQEFLSVDMLIPAQEEGLVARHVVNCCFRTLPFKLTLWQKSKLWLGCQLFVQRRGE